MTWTLLVNFNASSRSLIAFASLSLLPEANFRNPSRLSLSPSETSTDKRLSAFKNLGKQFTNPVNHQGTIWYRFAYYGISMFIFSFFCMYVLIVLYCKYAYNICTYVHILFVYTLYINV